MQKIKNIFFVIFGSFIASYSTVVFLNPNSVITGGGVGLAQLLYALFPSITLGMWIAIIAIPLILIGMKFFGKSFVFKTFITIVLISTFTDFLIEIVQVKPLTDETLLASIFGGLLIGFGVGLVILAGSSTGGTTILAEIIALKTRYKTSQIILVIDSLIMFASIYVYNDIEKSLFSVLGIYVTSRVIDQLLSGKPAQKAVSIVSQNVEVLSKQIYNKLGEHGTILKGVNLNQKEQKTIILVMVDISQLQLLKNIINEYDPEAFLVIQEASELYGRN